VFLDAIGQMIIILMVQEKVERGGIVCISGVMSAGVLGGVGGLRLENLSCRYKNADDVLLLGGAAGGGGASCWCAFFFWGHI
jgi:hypothetical protein